VLTNYYTLRALVDEWTPRLDAATVIDSYSQHKGSLILVFETSQGQEWSLNASVQAPNRHLFMYSGSNRSRKNVVDVFGHLKGQRVSAIAIADRDRLVTMTLESGDCIYFAIYGPQANVYFEKASSGITTSFRNTVSAPPPVRSAPPIPTAGQIEERLRQGKNLGSLLPLYPNVLIEEVWNRAGGTEDPVQLERVISSMEKELEHPGARIYWKENRQPLFSTIQLNHREEQPEVVDSVDYAVCLCARRRLAITRFSGKYDPLVRSIKSRTLQARKSLDRIQEEIAKPGRADQHEKIGHLIMAQTSSHHDGESEMTVLDWLGDGLEIRVRMDPNLSAIENAQRYYEKAKASRLAREKSVERLQGVRKTAESLENLLQDVLKLDSVEEVEQFQHKHAAWLKTLHTNADDSDSIPYRRYVLDEGYEVWVGRNAKQNDQLTLKDARKFDLWLHARGVAGSHAILRLRGREDKPPKRIVEQAASIAAWHSKARPSALVPVIVVERKYVRKPRKALPGAVVVEREKVILVEPGLPE